MRLQTNNPTETTDAAENTAHNGAARSYARPRSLWPDAVAFQEALQNPASALRKSGLSGGRVANNRLGLPLAYTGRFAAVFRVKDTGGASWAVRCFTSEGEGAQRAARYRAIFHHLETVPGSVRAQFVPFRYEETGVHVGGADYPLLVMAWAQGKPLGKWAQSHHQNSAALRRLCQTLSRLVSDLEAAQISHGDFQHDNLLISASGQRATLVDYDGIWVPALSHLPPNEMGHPNYQHPARNKNDFGPHGDRFAVLVLQTALYALSCDATLWETFGDKSDDALLFSRDDFLDPQNSPVFSVLRLAALSDPTLADLLSALEAACINHTEAVPVFSPDFFGPVENEAELLADELRDDVLKNVSLADELRGSVLTNLSSAAPSSFSQIPPSFPQTQSVAAVQTQKWWVQGAKIAPKRRLRANRIHRRIVWAATLVNLCFFWNMAQTVSGPNPEVISVFYALWFQSIIAAIGFYSWPDNLGGSVQHTELHEMQARLGETSHEIYRVEQHLSTLNANRANSSVVSFTQNRLQAILLTSIAAEVGLGLRELSPLSRAGITHLSDTTQMPDTISGAVQAKLQLARQKAVTEARTDFEIVCKTRRDLQHELERLRQKHAGESAACDELKQKASGSGSVAFGRFLGHLLSW